MEAGLEMLRGLAEEHEGEEAFIGSGRRRRNQSASFRRASTSYQATNSEPSPTIHELQAPTAALVTQLAPVEGILAHLDDDNFTWGEASGENTFAGSKSSAPRKTISGVINERETQGSREAQLRVTREVRKQRVKEAEANKAIDDAIAARKEREIALQKSMKAQDEETRRTINANRSKTPNEILLSARAARGLPTPKQRSGRSSQRGASASRLQHDGTNYAGLEFERVRTRVLDDQEQRRAMTVVPWSLRGNMPVLQL